MKRLYSLILSFSTVLFANSVSAEWGIGGFAGQSNGRSLINCQEGAFPTTTITTSSFDQETFFSELVTSDFSEISSSELITNDGIIGSFTSIDTVSFFDAIQDSTNGEFNIIETTTFLGTIEDLNSTPFISADFSSNNTVTVFEVDNQLVNFDATNFGEFLSGVSDNGLGVSADDLLNVFTAIEATESFSTFECSNDFNDFGYGLNITYNFNDTWGIELGYVELGEFSSTFSPTEVNVVGFPTTATVDASAFYLAATGSYYYNQKWSVTGRVGIYSVNADLSIRFENIEIARSSIREEDFYYGASWNYDLSEPIQLQLRYDNFDADVFSFGIKYRFGR